MRLAPVLLAASLIFAGGACSNFRSDSGSAARFSSERTDAFRRAHIWAPTRVEDADIRVGPPGAGAFQFLQTVSCDYVDKPLRGHSLKFACALGGDVVKVKIGGTNAEVYGEVAATRLLWALGFGADRMYPVRVMCRGCPSRFANEASPTGESLFDPAVIERPFAGATFDDDPGWSWTALDLVDERAGGAPLAHKDALKLLAVFLQHTDNKTEQQRLICRGQSARESPGPCARPFLILDDVGLTFGAANFLNDNGVGGANFRAWSRTAVWRDETGCVGNLAPSFSGTLSYPTIGEEGRRLLAGLMSRLSQQQIRDLFAVSRFDLRADWNGAGIDDWVRAFNDKRDQIVKRRCE